MSRSSIYRLIEEGKLSATTNHRGKKVVELTELLRVFGSIEEGTRQEDRQEEQKHNPTTQHGTIGKTGQDILFSTVRELEQLRFQVQLKDMELRLKDQEISSTKELLNQVKKTSEQMHQEKAQLLQIIERQTLLLAAPKPTPRPMTARTTKVEPVKPKATVAKVPLSKPRPPVKKAVSAPLPQKKTPQRSSASSNNNSELSKTRFKK